MLLATTILAAGWAADAFGQQGLPPVTIEPPVARRPATGVSPSISASNRVGRPRAARSPRVAQDRRVTRGVSTTPPPLTVGSGGLPPPTGTVGQPPEPYAGGQVGSGARLGFFGNRSFLSTPFNITGFTDKLIRDQQATSVAGVVANDPSVRNDVSPFSDRDSYFIRGFSVTNVDTAFDGLFYLASARRSFLEGIERVEVLKGPSALLNGGDGRIGGTINLIPKRAFDEPLTRLTTSFISKGQFGTHLDVGRRFGPSNEWGIRVNTAYRNGNTALDRNEIEVGNTTLGLDYRGERFRASIDIAHAVQNVTAPYSIFNAAAANVVIPRAPKPSLNTASSLEYIDSRYSMIAGRIEYDIVPGTTLYGAAGASRYNEDYLASNYTLTNSFGRATNSLAVAPVELRGFSGEVGLRSQFETGFIGHRVNIAAVHANSENYSRGYLNPTLPSFETNIYAPVELLRGSVFTASLPRSSQQPLFTELYAKSVAISDTLSFLEDRIQITVAGRYQEFDLQSYNTRPTANFGYLASAYNDNRISPAFAAVVRPFENLSIYGNYIEALQSGPTAPAVAVNANEVFAPIVSKQKEVGLKYDFGTVAVGAALFEIEQPNAFTDPTTRRFSVSGLQRNRGFEFTVFGEPVGGLRLLGGVTLIDAELVNTLGGRFNGKVAPGVPETAFNLYGEYDLPPWLLPGLTLTGRAIYTSKMFYDQANTQSVPDWARFDVGVRYQTTGYNGKPVVLRATVENVFNNAYWATASRGYLSVGAPRTYLVSATMDF
jgi:iron complex outermembrane receptor protein